MIFPFTCEKTFVIRNAEASDVDFMLSLARKEGWNPGLYDAKPFYSADPSGFVIGELNGSPIGCFAAVSYGKRFGFLGLLIVRKSYRGNGYGRRLFEWGLNHLEGCSIGLDGVADMVPFYSERGFQKEHSSYRFEGKGGGLCPSSLVQLNTVPFEQLDAYDTKCFGVNRRRFLEHWIHTPDVTALGYVERGKLRGFGVLRPCYTGFKIGPLFADHSDIALELFKGLRSKAKGLPFYFDVPEFNTVGLDIAERYAMDPVFRTERMYRGRPPKQRTDHVYGITSFELG